MRPQGANKSLRGRGGASPARGFAAMTILRVVRRHGYYAARCSHPGKSTQWVNRTERSRPFPTNLPEMPYHHGILQQQNSSPRRGGASPARDITAAAIYRVNRIEGFPLWGKLSPKVTDEGCLPGVSPSSGAFRATFPPRGRLFGRGGASPARGFAAMTILRVVRRHGYYAARAIIPANRPAG